MREATFEQRPEAHLLFSFPRDAHTNFEHSLLFFTSFTGAEPHSNQPIMPVTTSTVGEY